MRVAISGSTGLIGSALVQALRWGGDEVVRLTRRAPISPDERRWEPADGRIDGPGLDDVDAVVNLAGAPIATRWTSANKAEILSSRVQATSTVVAHLTPDGRCQRLVNGSAIGFYGNTGDGPVDESNPRGDGFLADVVAAWEDAASDAPVSTALARTGNVLSPHGGYLGQQLPLFRLGLGGRMGAGTQWVSWITLDDEVAALRHLLTSELTGPVDLTSPEPVRNAELTKALGQALHRPTVLPVPVPAVRLIFGNEMVDEAVLGSQRVLPTRLQVDGFAFAEPRLGPALTSMFGR